MKTYLFSYVGYMKNASASFFPSYEDAKAATAVLPNETTAHVVSDENYLAGFAPKFLVDAFNALGGDSVSRFESRAVGVRRLFAKIEATAKEGKVISNVPASAASDPKPAEGVAPANDEEADMAATKKKAAATKPKAAAKAKTAKAPKAPKAPKEPREKGAGSSSKLKKGDPLNDAQTKVLSMIERSTGATLAEIMERLDMTEGTARNAVGRVRKKTGLDIAVDREATGERKPYRVFAK